MAEDKLSSRINTVLLSGRADETLAYSKHIKDYDTGKSVKQDLEERVKKTDQLVTDQLADSAVTTPKLADQSVSTEKLADKSVTTPKLQDSSVTTEKLNDRSVTTDKLADKSITNPKLADKSVDGRVIKDSSVDTNHLSNDSVTTEKVKDKSITNDKVADNTLKIDKLDPELRKSIQAATGLPEDLVQMIQDVDESIKSLHDTDDNLQNQLDDHQSQIDSNDTDIAALQDRSTQMEQSIKDIAISGGASVASAVSYNDDETQLDAINVQSAIEKLTHKNAAQDETIATKADTSQVEEELAKKFDKGNIAQELGDSEDKVVSQYALPFRVVESEEWAYLIMDAEDHVLFGIQQDGSVEWSEGVPSPIRKRINEIDFSVQDNKLELSKEIDQLNTSLLAEIQSLKDTKVDKEEGKSLISDEVKDSFEVVDSDEFLDVKKDAEDHILEAITADGEKQINLPTSVPSAKINGAAEITSEENDEWLDLKKDNADHILEGISQDGKKYINLPLVNPTIQALQEQVRQSTFEIEFDEETGDINAILGDNSTITDVTSDEDGNIYLTEDITHSSATDPDTLATIASVDEPQETAIFNT